MISNSYDRGYRPGTRNATVSAVHDFFCAQVHPFHPSTGQWRRLCNAGCSLLVFLVFVFGPVVSLRGQDAPSESQVKAAFLLNFAKYVDWPASAFSEADSPIVVGVFDNDDVAQEFSAMSEKRTVNGRQFRLVRVTTPEECRRCHILFIGAKEGRHCRELLAALREADILTVGETDEFLDQGGMINLAERDRRIAIEVNMDSVRASNLKVSSKLLAVATLKGGKK